MCTTVKVLYDYLKENEASEYAVTSALQTLLTEGFESEQIWEQLNLQMDGFMEKVEQKFATVASEDQDEDEEEEEDMDMDAMNMDLEDGEGEDDFDFLKQYEEDDELLLDEDDEEEQEMITQKRRPVKAKKNLPQELSQLEDGFFDLEEMHRFADEGEYPDDEEAKTAMKSLRRKTLVESGEMEEDEEVDEGNDVDIFSQIEDDGNTVMFDDFFMQPAEDEADMDSLNFDMEEDEDSFDMQDEDMEMEMEEDEDEQDGIPTKAKAKSIMDDSDDEQEEEKKEVKFFEVPAEYEIDDSAHVADELMTPFAKRQEALQKQISSIEEQLMGPKSWQLAGESKAHRRELDVLLDEDLDIEYATKMAMPVTEEVAEEIDTLIKQRIKDGAWDDVAPRIPPPEKLFEPQEEVSSEKARFGLAEIYEKEYMQMAMGTTSDAQVKLNADHEEISGMFASLCHHLDSLSNFHYTPKGKNIELQITSSAPAVQMEEVLPMAVSEADRAAPQEIFQAASRGLVASREEQTKEEKDNARRMRQDKKRKHFDYAEEKTKQSALAGDVTAQKAIEQKDFNKRYKEATGAKKVTRLSNTDSTKYSTSANFFQKIQDDVDRRKTGAKPTSKKEPKAPKSSSYMQ
jgi:U3 small nucleolar RNA-associated protein MPP10